MTKELLKELGIAVDDSRDYSDEEIGKLLKDRVGGLNADLSKHKDLLSKRNSEINALKDKEKEKLTEDEKTKLFYEELEATNKKLNREISLSKKIADYIGIGYDRELAGKIAEAELDGKSTTEFHRQHIEAVREAEKKALLNKNPVPHTNSDTSTLTKEEVLKGGYEAMMKLQTENPAKYNEFFGNK